MLSLSDEDRRSLLQLARLTVTEVVTRRRLPGSVPKEGVFAARCGAFVTLHVRDRLRGCIGIIEAQQPLGEVIVHCSLSAALQDPRFPPLSAEEVLDLVIEISLLSPPEPILPENIEIGKHGLLISSGGQRGLLLPQVALEHRLTRDSFLEETCRKAGLNRDAWREASTELFAFTCEVFAESGRATGS
jgi:AmmeMemoRadiSam system protein A